MYTRKSIEIFPPVDVMLETNAQFLGNILDGNQNFTTILSQLSSGGWMKYLAQKINSTFVTLPNLSKSIVISSLAICQKTNQSDFFGEETLMDSLMALSQQIQTMHYFFDAIYSLEDQIQNEMDSFDNKFYDLIDILQVVTESYDDSVYQDIQHITNSNNDFITTFEKIFPLRSGYANYTTSNEAIVYYKNGDQPAILDFTSMFLSKIGTAFFENIIKSLNSSLVEYIAPYQNDFPQITSYTIKNFFNHAKKRDIDSFLNCVTVVQGLSENLANLTNSRFDDLLTEATITFFPLTDLHSKDISNQYDTVMIAIYKGLKANKTKSDFLNFLQHVSSFFI